MGAVFLLPILIAQAHHPSWSSILRALWLCTRPSCVQALASRGPRLRAAPGCALISPPRPRALRAGFSAHAEVGLSQGPLNLIGSLKAWVISAEFVGVVATARDVPIMPRLWGGRKKWRPLRKRVTGVTCPKIGCKSLILIRSAVTLKRSPRVTEKVTASKLLKRLGIIFGPVTVQKGNR